VVRHFQAFCLLAGHSFPYFTTEAVTQFVLHHAVRHTGYTFRSCIKPALVYLEIAMGKATSFTPTIDLLLKGAKRRARARSGPAKKAPALFPVQLACSRKDLSPRGSCRPCLPYPPPHSILRPFHIPHTVPLLLLRQTSGKAL
jgi:hypothetical protein